ncbi:MAG TPA: hypothetical protein VM536_20660 [Chloroflexia bacterium]|nr:hypothetical protein [Chloroflexia bacterium]
MEQGRIRVHIRRSLARPLVGTSTVSGATAVPGYRALAVFVGPLLFTGLMMTTDTPVVNAALARLPRAEEALAAFVVAFSLALLYEAPHIMMIEVGTTLATTRQALALLRRFYGLMALVVGIIGATVVFTPLYDLLVSNVMQIPLGVAEAARPAVAVFLLWPLPIGWRRLHQGALIRHGQSRAVGAGAFARIGMLLAAMAVLLPTLGGSIPSSALGALAMLASVTAEAAYTHWTANRLLRDLPARAADGQELTQRGLWQFYWPLAGTSLLNTLNRPLLSAGLAAAASVTGGIAGADVALAAWGVAFGMLFLVNGATLTLGQVAIAWDAHPEAAYRRRGDRLILGLGVGLTLLVAAAVVSPVAAWLLDTIYTVSPAVRAAALPVLALLTPVPLFFTVNSLLRGKLINRRQTRLVQRAGLIDLLVLAAVLFAGVHWPDPATRPAATTLGALAMLAVYSTDFVVLGLGLRRTPRPVAVSAAA